VNCTKGAPGDIKLNASNKSRSRVVSGLVKQQTAERRIELDQHEARGIDALRHQRLGHWPSAGPKLDDGAGHVRVDIARHGAGERLARGRNRARGQRALDPGAEEAHVVELRAVLLQLEAADVRAELLLLRLDLLLEALDVALELLLDCIALLLENLDLAVDLAAELAPFEDEEAALLLEFPLETLQGWEGHVGLLTPHNDYSFVTDYG